MYFSPPFFPALCNYVSGCEATLRQVAPQHPLALELDGFDAWLCVRFEITLPSFRWQQVIWEREDDDKKRVQMFVDLLLRYRHERGGLHSTPNA